ncbi:MAG: transposase [Chloroflexi bacterium]|nr:transposase [Chloroflexota bacterium]MCI0645676.1 transposase [Chloroflexota bacterium]
MSQKQSTIVQGNGVTPGGRPADPEVVPCGQRRRFTAAYKQRIVEEAERCDQPGQVGALLRREGLYSSHLNTWRRQRAAGQLQGLAVQQRGRKSQQDGQAVELARLRRENERLRRQLEQAELIIAAQKKLAQALEQTLSDSKEAN